MRPPPKAIQPLIEMISNPEMSVDEMLTALQKADPAQLKRNGFWLLQAIPNLPQAHGLIMFAVVHHALGSDHGVFAGLVDTAIRGRVADGDKYVIPEDSHAHDFLEFLLDRDWVPVFTSALIFSCAYGKRECARLLVERGFYKQRGYGGDWDRWLRNLDDEKALQMAKVLIDVVKPSRKDLKALRMAARPGSPLSSFLQGSPAAA